ncbi:hypothetical protein HPB51_010365 [Rhipicephalus microplus]|uniref:Ionotropic glutamate receptor L-glutamate and glycine-binding domain-containing protein n=1 Tax=Rhipicephalus microplus TaxID=6941 RepID=A0A9J6DUE9_RHIMP|nr:hypothetical protein HPB51_010365 [Rhipicephalus microplus]
MDEVQMSGPMANLLDLLTENLGFTYTLHSPEDGHWGVPLPNGNWTGLVGMMHNNISDLALGPLVMTYGRSLVTTFSSQVTTDYLTILAGFPNIIHASIFGTLMAFELQVWLALLASLLFCFSAAVMFDLFSQRKMGTPIKDILLANWWMYFSVLFNEAAPRTPRGTPSRVVFAMWWLTVVVLMNAFTGHMKATMMVRREPDRIDSMKDLAKHNHMKTFVWKGSAYESLLKNSLNIPEYQAVWRMVVRCNGTIETKSLYSKANLIEVQQGLAAIVGDATTMRFHVATNCGVLRHGTFYFSKEQFFPHKYAVALNRYEDPAFVAAINQRAHPRHLRNQDQLDGGEWLLDGWMEEQYGDWRKCSAGSEEVYQPLSLFEAQSIFVIYLMFSAAAAVAFLGELLVGGKERISHALTV